MTEGICFFAYNNDQIDYVKLATIAASYAKRQLGKPVCLITDAGSMAWLKESQPKHIIDSCFNDKPHLFEQYLYDVGIPMWWSTVVYFDRSEESKIFFDSWEHVADNYEFYQYLYNFPGKLFRTDYCTSIAIHIMNGMIPGNVVHDFCGLPMQNMSQYDDIIEVKNLNEWICLANDTVENWNNIAVRHSNNDVHVMNKRSLERFGDRLLGLLYE